MPAHGSPAPAAVSTCRTIALINQKGGVGKTTTTVNLGAALALQGKRVLIVDLDPQAHATLSLGVDPAAEKVIRSVYDLILDWDDGADPAVQDVRPGLSLIPAETDLAAAESELSSAPDRHRRLAKALAPLRKRFDFILIDCPPSLGLLTINGLSAAREVIIPMQAHFLALQGVGKLLETVKLVRAKINPELKVTGVVLCNHDSSSTHTSEVVSDLTSFLEQAKGQDVPWNAARVFRPAIRRNIKLAECPSFGQTIFDYAPGAPGAADYKALAAAIAAPAAPDQPEAGVAAEAPTIVVTAPAAEAAR